MFRSFLIALPTLLVSASAAFAASITPGSYQARFLAAGESFEVSEIFRANENGRICVRGFGRSYDDTDLEVYDENENLVAEGSSLNDQECVTINPRWTGEFFIRVINNGARVNRVILETQ